MLSCHGAKQPNGRENNRHDMTGVPVETLQLMSQQPPTLGGRKSAVPSLALILAAGGSPWT